MPHGVVEFIMDSFELLESFLRMLVIISTFIPETFHNVIQHFIYSQNHSTHVKFNKAPESNKVTYIPSDSLIPEPFMLLLSRTNEKRQATTVQSRPVFPQTAPGVKLPCALTSI